MNDRLSAQYWLHEQELTAYSSEAVRDRRRSAMERFEAVGFPTVRDEDWKYSSLKPVLAPHYGLRPPCAQLHQQVGATGQGTGAGRAGCQCDDGFVDGGGNRKIG